MKKIQLLFIAFVVLLGVAFAANVFLSRHNSHPVTVSSQSTAPIITYKGQKGQDALTLLKQQATIAQTNSGLVTTINGVKANRTNHEYWAFYINGHLATIPASDYQTKNSDTITWKLEKY